jgi:hypothetical protein
LALTVPLIKVYSDKYHMRPICPTCTERPVAVNCHKNEQVYYRKQCDRCLRKGKKLKPHPPLWALRGYKKKPQCEKCGFSADMPDKQLQVFHVDGNLKNVDWVNLKTVCLNCQPVVYKSRLPWKPAGPVPGF